MKELLKHLFRTTADEAEWFAPFRAAIDGLSESQARWKPAGADHSIAAITAHLQFYQLRELNKFLGLVNEPFTDDNDSTFREPAEAGWAALAQTSLETLTRWQTAVAGAGEDKLRNSARLIGEITGHLAYHTGQIVLMRKWQGSWDADKGVR